MKKALFVAMAALAMMTAACGGSKSQKEGTQEDEKAAWQTYTNDNYGYSVEVPGDMDKRETMTEDSGTIYSYDGKEGFTVNRIDITGSENMFGEAYTPEKVRSDFDYYTEEKELAAKECGDDYFSYTIVGDELTETHYHVFNGTKQVIVAVCYDKDHEAQLGGDVAQHVFQSVKFK